MLQAQELVNGFMHELVGRRLASLGPLASPMPPPRRRRLALVVSLGSGDRGGGGTLWGARRWQESSPEPPAVKGPMSVR